MSYCGLRIPIDPGLGLFKEYYRDPQKTYEAYHDGIYYTGDVAWRDEDGYFWFVGRLGLSETFHQFYTREP